jgi:hypothetical protein
MTARSRVVPCDLHKNCPECQASLAALKQQQCHPAACRDEMVWREQLRLERAAALQLAAEIPFASAGPNSTHDAILAMIEDSDRSALDAIRQESREQGWQEAIKLVETGTKAYAGKWPDALRTALDAHDAAFGEKLLTMVGAGCYSHHESDCGVCAAWDLVRKLRGSK